MTERCRGHGQDHLRFEQLLAWVARRNPVGDEDEDQDEDEDESDSSRAATTEWGGSSAQLRRHKSSEGSELAGAELLAAGLEDHLAGEYGDVHLQDLASVMKKDVLDAAASVSGETSQTLDSRERTFKSRVAMGGLKGLTAKTAEMHKIIRDAFRFTTHTNDSFPSFPDHQIVMFAQQMIKVRPAWHHQPLFVPVQMFSYPLRRLLFTELTGFYVL